MAELTTNDLIVLRVLALHPLQPSLLADHPQTRSLISRGLAIVKEERGYEWIYITDAGRAALVIPAPEAS